MTNPSRFTPSAINPDPILKVAGSLHQRGDLTRSAVRVTGSFRLSGSLDTGELHVNGSCRIRQACRARSLRSAGSFRSASLSGGRVDAAGYFAVDDEASVRSLYAEGALRIGSLLAAETAELRLRGRSTAGTIRAGGQITVAPSSRALAWLTAPFRRLRCTEVEGDEVELSYTTADRVCGNVVRIGPGCRIGEVRYSADLYLDPSAIVGSIVREALPGSGE
ncbi:hypothetical protein ACE6ED_11475 [Paenibacillus sp. CN-4]|uniref:hypothetical protein n=1 Tax=Paenibacillus nanchangensis TaxID=3348343 RepID=UPI0039797A1F